MEKDISASRKLMDKETWSHSCHKDTEIMDTYNLFKRCKAEIMSIRKWGGLTSEHYVHSWLGSLLLAPVIGTLVLVPIRGDKVLESWEVQIRNFWRIEPEWKLAQGEDKEPVSALGEKPS
jgi:hypothetical protein